MQQASERFNEVEQQEVYFRHYAAWENEQLACVHDYLVRALSIPVDDFALHDVKWGEHIYPGRADYQPPANHWKQYGLSRGLTFLQRLIATETHEQCGRILNDNLCRDHLFLYAGLAASTPCDGCLRLLSMEQLRSLAGRPFFHDDDEGPEEAWTWAYERELTRLPYFSFDVYDLRVWGFCLWDLDRLSRVLETRATKRSYRGYEEFILAGCEKVHQGSTKSWEERSRGAKTGHSMAMAI